VDAVPLPMPTGRLWLCGKHFVGPDPDLALERTGAAAIVCLNERGELYSRYPEYVDWLKANLATGRAMWHPIPDLHVPAVEVIEPFIDELHGRLAAGEGLLVHCGAGIGRAGTVAAALLLRMGASLDEALAVVAASRPSAGPQTSEQADLLADLSARPGPAPAS
jgi:hypothetical protein